MRVYVSGPMSNMPDFNFPAFAAAAARLRAQGYEVINPAEHGEVPGMKWADYIRKDLKLLADCDAIYLLPGWRQSRGARLEHRIAAELGFAILGGED